MISQGPLHYDVQGIGGDKDGDHDYMYACVEQMESLQYSMSSDPKQKGVAKRCERTLMDMLRSMTSHSTLSISLQMDAPKTIAHLLKRVPSKSMHKTPYGLWTQRKPSLNYLHVWGYLVEVKIFNPNVGKFVSKIVSCHFIGYSERSKGYCLYCSGSYTKFIETRHIVFL